MTIKQLFRNRLIASGIAAAAAIGIGVAGLVSDRIFFLPAGMMAVAALIGFHLAATSYRFDRGLAGPPEWRTLVRDAKAWSEDRPSPEGAVGDQPSDVPTPDRL
ncbi:MAG TPA: hypothetical protein VL426_06550 [Candidatus Binatia bacterium]|nr:hypothetical protein [Candidatus Binatia bacterium]